MGGLVRRAYNVCDWIAKVAILNLIWLLFTLAGLVVFGIVPATIALFTVVRKWTLSETDAPVFRVFFETFKKEFLRGNLLGLFIIAIGFFLFYDLKLVLSISGSLQFVLGVPLLIIIGCYLLVLLYIFPVYVTFELKFLNYFKYALYMSLLNLHITIFMMIAIVLVWTLLTFLPGFIPFFGVSVIAVITMFSATGAFQRIENKQMKYNA